MVPFQINPHYPMNAVNHDLLMETRDQRLREFLEENEVPVLGLSEGSWGYVLGRDPRHPLARKSNPRSRSGTESGRLARTLVYFLKLGPWGRTFAPRVVAARLG
jgi:dipeptidase E